MSKIVEKKKPVESEDEEYYDEEDDDREAVMAKALASVDQNKLASWLDRICPKVIAILEANNS